MYVITNFSFAVVEDVPALDHLNSEILPSHDPSVNEIIHDTLNSDAMLLPNYPLLPSTSGIDPQLFISFIFAFCDITLNLIPS